MTGRIDRQSLGCRLSPLRRWASRLDAIEASAAEQAQQQAQQIQDQGPDPADANMAPVDGSVAQQPATRKRQSDARRPVRPIGPPPGRLRPSNGVIRLSGYPPADTSNAQPMTRAQGTDQDAGQPVVYADHLRRHCPTTINRQPRSRLSMDPRLLELGPAGYYWVPGVWCAPPYQGALWTPGYWDFYSGRYRFHPGYWGLYVGFYGGINYGYGYYGTGYRGGLWNGPHFYYNTAVTRVNTYRITYVYNRHVSVNNVSTPASPITAAAADCRYGRHRQRSPQSVSSHSRHVLPDAGPAKRRAEPPAVLQSEPRQARRSSRRKTHRCGPRNPNAPHCHLAKPAPSRPLRHRAIVRHNPIGRRSQLSQR